MGVRNWRTMSSVVAEERDDADGPGVLDDLARVPPAVGVLDGVDAEGDEATAVQDAPVDRRLDEVFVAHPRSIRRLRATGTRLGARPPGRPAGWCVAAHPVLVRLPHGGWTDRWPVCAASGRTSLSTETEHSRPAPRATARPQGDSGMSRYKELALRLAVVASFVLVLAAPFRW